MGALVFVLSKACLGDRIYVGLVSIWGSPAAEMFISWWLTVRCQGINSMPETDHEGCTAKDIVVWIPGHRFQ